MPKAPKFKSSILNESPEDRYNNFSTNKTKGAGIGIGVRHPYPQWLERNMK